MLNFVKDWAVHFIFSLPAQNCTVNEYLLYIWFYVTLTMKAVEAELD